MAKFKLVQHDTLPEISLFLADKVTGAPIDLSAINTVVRLKFRAEGATELKDTLVLVKKPGTVVSIDDDTTAQTVKYGDPYLADGSGGRCVIQFGSTTLDTAGDFEGEIEIAFAAGAGILTYWDLLKFTVREDFPNA